MLVYGDRTRLRSPRDMLAGLGAALARIAAMPPGLLRHGALAGALIEAGELVQGIADAEFAARGADADTPAQSDAMALLSGLAGALHASWQSGFARLPPLPRIAFAAPLPERVETRLGEGFAFYALYPEAYAAAAAASGLPPATRVIGLRSIGAPLAAMVAAGLGADPPATLRPAGHPFRREVAVAPGLAARLGQSGPFAVVDEGPGLSGSSFGAVADWLEDRGTPPERIAFFPGHAGAPGPQAAPRHRARWERAARHLTGFEELVLHARRPAHRLEAWAAELLGPLDGPLEELSGGAWRARHYPGPAAWPPVHPWQERRKFLAHAGGATWLLKFTGLGAEGERKAAHARALAAAGLAPPVAGWRHGFLAERWMEGARPLDACPVEPGRLAAAVARFLAFRASAFPAAPGRGADPAALHAMARYNAGAALGAAARRWFDRYSPSALARLAARARPVETDNRLHPWEWLVLPDGRLLKTDAVDHHAGHDLVGCQDIAWDAAGAMVELGLGPDPEADPELLRFLLPCYCAFQLGHWTMAAEAAAAPEEEARLRRAAGRYADRLRQEIAR